MIINFFWIGTKMPIPLGAWYFSSNPPFQKTGAKTAKSPKLRTVSFPKFSRFSQQCQFKKSEGFK